MACKIMGPHPYILQRWRPPFFYCPSSLDTAIILRNLHLSIYTYIHIHVYTYIYICMHTHTCYVYIYIYTYTYNNIRIYKGYPSNLLICTKAFSRSIRSFGSSQPLRFGMQCLWGQRRKTHGSLLIRN